MKEFKKASTLNDEPEKKEPEPEKYEIKNTEKK
jgi:hypothetical protein